MSNKYKKLLLTSLSIASFLFSGAQPTAVFADPAVVSFDLTDLADVSVPDANNLTTNTIYKLKLFVLNLDQTRTVPNGTCEIRIGLGSKMILDPAFNLANAPFNNYFAWSSTSTGSQVQITGTIINPLPPNFTGELSFNVKSKTSTIITTSSFSANFLITNVNPLYLFSDLNPNNNTASLSYSFTFLGPLPVNITKFTATNEHCTIAVNWSVGQEIDLARYELEYSNDGISFRKIAEKAAESKSDYSTSYSLIESDKARFAMIRIKCVNLDGTFKYSDIVRLSGNCNNKVVSNITIYPNPVSENKQIQITNKDAFFNGNYQLTIIDHSGKKYTTQLIEFLNTSTFSVPLPAFLARGKYYILMMKENGTEKVTLSFEKL